MEGYQGIGQRLGRGPGSQGADISQGDATLSIMDGSRALSRNDLGRGSLTLRNGPAPIKPGLGLQAEVSASIPSRVRAPPIIRWLGRLSHNSIELMSLVWKLPMQSPTEKLVMLALCDWANERGESRYPSMKSIALKSCLSEQQAKRIVHSLIRHGSIFVMRNKMGGKHGDMLVSEASNFLIVKRAPKLHKGAAKASAKKTCCATIWMRVLTLIVAQQKQPNAKHRMTEKGHTGTP